jgi:alpha-beta hydrolase superfamily lysophospholipase
MSVSIRREPARVRTADGLELWARSWLPERPRAAVLLVHGLAEHVDRYDHVGAGLAERGFAAWAADHRGHGRSPGRRVHVSSFDEYLLDVRGGVELIRERQPGLPLFLLGHSQGGLVSLLFALRHPDSLAGLAVTSPFLAAHASVKPGAPLAAAAGVLSRIWPSLLFPNEVAAASVSRHPEVVAAYGSDPLISRKVSARWFISALAAQSEVLQRLPELRLPGLVMAAGDDRLVDPEVTRQAVERAVAAGAPLQFVPWPGLYHELLNEPERAAVLGRIADWLGERLG